MKLTILWEFTKGDIKGLSASFKDLKGFRRALKALNIAAERLAKEVFTFMKKP